MKSFTVPHDTYSISKENLFLDQLLRRIVFSLVENESFNGAIGKNSFNFKHRSVDFVSLYKAGTNTIYLLQLNCNQSAIFEVFCHFTDSGLYFNDSRDDISLETYVGGHTLNAINLTPNMAASCSHFQLVKTGNICLELHFFTPPTETINIIIHAEFENLLQIHRDKYVLTDF